MWEGHAGTGVLTVGMISDSAISTTQNYLCSLWSIISPTCDEMQQQTGNASNLHRTVCHFLIYSCPEQDLNLYDLAATRP